MIPVKFIVVRGSKDEFTFATVTARINIEKLDRDGEFLEALTNAVTEWVRTTKEGKAEWTGSSEDFNVGDLSNCCHEPALLKILAEHGIWNLEIETCVENQQARGWVYDTILVDTSKLEEAGD